ncbi:MAG: hypothetical protein ACRELE_04470, partial [Gemmatimonadales bacterium]
LLLNVGPMASGQFPPEAIERLGAIAGWMRDHADTIHGTTASLFATSQGFLSTTAGTAIHLFVLDWKAGPLELPALTSRPVAAWLRGPVHERRQLSVIERGSGYAVILPDTPPSALLPVVTLRFVAKPEVRS